MTVVKFMIEHLRETLIATGARVASLGDEDCRTSMQLAGIMIVRLAGFTSQSPSELVSAAAVRAVTPVPCKTSVQGATALKALREIVSEHMEGREGGQHVASSGAAGRMRSSSLSSSGVLMQKLGLPVATTRLQMFHVADAGGFPVGPIFSALSASGDSFPIAAPPQPLPGKHCEQCAPFAREINKWSWTKAQAGARVEFESGT
jgi:hypothetical protein